MIKSLTKTYGNIYLFVNVEPSPNRKRFTEIMPDKKTIKQRLTEQADVFSSYHISRVGLFGSFARGTQTENSDIDLLVEFNTKFLNSSKL